MAQVALTLLDAHGAVVGGPHIFDNAPVPGKGDRLVFDGTDMEVTSVWFDFLTLPEIAAVANVSARPAPSAVDYSDKSF